MNYKIKRQLTQIMEICIRKGLTFQVFPNVENVSIYNYEHAFNLNSYYDGKLSGKTLSGGTIPLAELLQKVKEYQPETK